MGTSNYALRLQKSIKSEAEKIAKVEGTTLNQFINVAVAEKVATLSTAYYFKERRKKSNISKALKILQRIGNEESTREGDELI